MDIFSILELLGGLSLFLFGMNIMGDSLEKIGGSRLKSILEQLTSSPLKGILLGAGVTAIIQSSSATTVMVVGFVNSGIMSLSNSIGIIMGANIGTTITAWLMSLIGLESDNIIVSLLKPSSFSPILAFIGIILTMVNSKKPFKKDLGAVFLGFAVLMTGMELMSASVSGLKENESFTSILTLFETPIAGLLAGAILTAIIQSSSASVGILQALSVTGQISYAAAVPIILGQNIGTCITAILSSIGTNKNAKRTSAVHLSFNIIGSIVFMLGFYLIDAIIGFSFMHEPINAAGIAVVHTIFNISSTIILFPFVKQLEKLAYIIIRDKEPGELEKTKLLDDRLLNTPSVAIKHAGNITCDMAKMAVENIKEAMVLIENYSDENSIKVSEYEEQIDKYEDKLGTYLVKVSHQRLNYEDSHEVSRLLHCIGDFERISDHAVNLAETAKEIYQKKIQFTPSAEKEIKVAKAALYEILDLTLDSFTTRNLQAAKNIEPLEQVIDKLKTQMKAGHIKRLKEGDCTMESGFIFSDFLTNIERTADHCSNIAVCLLEIENDSFKTHEYLKRVKSNDNNDFQSRYDLYDKKYSF